MLSNSEIKECYDKLLKAAKSKTFNIREEDRADLISDVMEVMIKKHGQKCYNEFIKIAYTSLLNLHKDRFGRFIRGGDKLSKLTNSYDIDGGIDFDCLLELSTENNNEKKNEFDNLTYLVEKVRWGGYVISPFTGTTNFSYYNPGVYRCMDTLKYFTVATNSIFDLKEEKKRYYPWVYYLVIVNEIIGGTRNIDVIFNIIRERSKMSNSSTVPPSYRTTEILYNRIFEVLNKQDKILGMPLNIALEHCFDYKEGESIMENNELKINEFRDSYIEKVLNNPDEYEEKELIEIFKFLRWGDYVKSPYDPSSKVYVYRKKENSWRCGNTELNFSLTTNTVFQANRLPIKSLFIAIREFFFNRKNTVALSKLLGINQAAAWKIVYKIKVASQDFSNDKNIFEFFKQVIQYDKVENVVVPLDEERQRTRKIKSDKKNKELTINSTIDMENKKDDNLSILEIRPRSEAENNFKNERRRELILGIQSLLLQNKKVPLEFIEEYNDLLK